MIETLKCFHCQAVFIKQCILSTRMIPRWRLSSPSKQCSLSTLNMKIPTQPPLDWAAGMKSKRIKIKFLWCPPENQLSVQIPVWFLLDYFKPLGRKSQAALMNLPQWATFMQLFIAKIKFEVGEIKVLKGNYTKLEGNPAIEEWILTYKL